MAPYLGDADEKLGFQIMRKLEWRPQDRPGEVLPNPFLLLPRGPEGTGARWMKRCNSAPRTTLGLRTPGQVEFAKLRELVLITGEIRRPKLKRRLTSSGN